MADYTLLVNLLRDATLENSNALGVMALKAEFETAVFQKLNFTQVNENFSVTVPLNQALLSAFRLNRPELTEELKAHITAAISSESDNLDIKAINVLGNNVSIIFNVK